MAAPLSSKLAWEIANPLWAGALNPVLSNPLNQVSILSNVKLKTGVNVINHLLGRLQQGWFLVDLQGNQTVYRSAPFNETTLSLTASGAVTLSIGVF